MQKKAIAVSSAIIIVVSLFIVLSASMFFLQEKKLTGFAVYSNPGNTCGFTMSESSIFSADVTCLAGDGLTIMCSDCTLDCQGYSFNGNIYDETTGLIIQGTNVTIKNCNMNDWYICTSGNEYIGINNSGCLNNTECTSNWQNITTEWQNLNCLSEGRNQSRNITQYDANGCNETNTTWTEYRILYISLVNTSWSEWQNLTCVNEQMNQSRYLTQYDANDTGCYENETIYDYRLDGPILQNTTFGEWQEDTCIGNQMRLKQSATQYDLYGCKANETVYNYTFVGPNWTYTDWTDWQNVGCAGNDMNQSRSRIKYDSYGCAENVTEYEYQLVGPEYINVSIGEWQDYSCVNSTTKNQSQEINQSDIYGCADNRTIYNYRLISCNSGYICSEGICVASSSGGGGSGGGGESCSDECSSGQEEKSCVNSTTIKIRTCGNYDSDSCLEWSSYSYESCSYNYICEEGSCIKNITCINECLPDNYPQCKDSKTSLLCKLKDDGCYYIKTDTCSDNEECNYTTGICSLITKEIIEEEKPETKKIKFKGKGTNITLSKPSDFIPHGDIPDVVVDTAAYTTTVAVIATSLHFLWLWIISLFLPFFILRLRHICLAYIDTNMQLPFVSEDKNKKQILINKKEIEKFISLLENHFKEKIILVEETQNSYRFLFYKEGFMEIQFDYPLIINIHFSSSRRTRSFKKAFLETIKTLYGIEKMKKIEKSIIITKESASIISAIRNISRERKLKKLAENFKK
ncbi:MAG: hypothetical protein QW117_03165 [Candidatus Pacearchaeota archaeon]